VGVEPAFIRQQMELVLDDIGADALKTGMLHSAAVIEVVAAVVAAKTPRVPLVVDPVMVAKGGARLIAEDAIGALKTKLIAHAAVITPNLPEAEVLVGSPVANVEAMKRAAESLRKLGCSAVLLKGGHLESDVVSDVLASADGIEVFEGSRIVSRNTHGTGCTLASAIATGLGQKMSLRDAVLRARAYVRKAIETAPQIGHGHGPLHHGHAIAPYKQ
jgi:hydroxymethylpyrimidine/phosphomethylpyrimidine kinase